MASIKPRPSRGGRGPRPATPGGSRAPSARDARTAAPRRDFGAGSPPRARVPGRSAAPRLATPRQGGGLPSPFRVSPLIVDQTAHLLARLFRFEGPADAVMARYFREQPRLGRRDRSQIAETAFDALRRLATLGWMISPAHPARAPRLAALVALARLFGIDAIDPAGMRSDLRAVQGALALDHRQAPKAVRAEAPLWAFRRIEAQYPDGEALLAAQTAPASLDLRVNTLLADRGEVLQELRGMGGDGPAPDAMATPWSPDGIRLEDKQALMRWPVYEEGRIEIQDEGSQLIARLVAPRRGEMVVDLCAGAGGKTLALGSLMRSTGRIYAFDTHVRRLTGLAPRLKRSGLSNVHPAAIDSENDLRLKRLGGKIDRVLVDAPCSGSGTWRRNPDLKWRFDEAELSRLIDIQARLLVAGARLLKPGGRLVYATCSLFEVENRKQVESFVAQHPQFAVVDARSVLAPQGVAIEGAERFAPWFVMLPHLHGTDGFFGAVLERRE